MAFSVSIEALRYWVVGSAYQEMILICQGDGHQMVGVFHRFGCLLGFQVRTMFLCYLKNGFSI